MKILAIETATGLGGVALIEDENLLAEYRMDMAMAHSERLMVMVDRVLTDGGLTMDDLDALAVSIGPGSFTGLRVAVSTVKGLVTGKPIPVAAVPTLEAMAWTVPAGPHSVCPMIDAKKREVYAALFSCREDGTLKRVMDDQVISPEVLCERLCEPSSPPTVFLGDGASKYREVLEKSLGRRAVFAPAPLSRPLPSMVAWLGLRKLQRGEAADARSLVPVYVRRPDAELNWEKGVAPKKLKLKRKRDQPSEQGEREGEAPSGSASGGGDASPYK
ncbi:MAG: tRNA (adenosine(37)-N6)-threonylcarbamoyltransferase complex dimerization subunit type 1 TsaB [Nitrospirae bacterium]|nr:tRNA (adenosine(37)-N6)-threonylcarbamoyltransferase complex dimerization subunit type 1 TsaB [Nitrospirota bacterium]